MIRASKGATSACHVIEKNLGRQSGHERPAVCRGVPTDPPSPAPPGRLLAGPPRPLVVAVSWRGRKGRAALHLRLWDAAATGPQRGGARGAEIPRARRPHPQPRLPVAGRRMTTEDPPSPAPPGRLLAGPPRQLVVAAARRGRRGRAAPHLRLRQPAAADPQR